MAADGTVTLDLFRDGDGRPVHARVDYAPGTPHYAAVLAHLRGLAPGETKPVMPWRDDQRPAVHTKTGQA